MIQEFHSLAEKRSWALHCEVARRLLSDSRVLERARERVRGWLVDPVRHPYAQQWDELLGLPLEDVAERITRKDAESCTLRQASPFAGAIDPRTRWAILKRPDLRSREAG